MSRKVLLVVDVQKGFINKHTAHIPAMIQGILPLYDVVFATKFFNAEQSNYRRLIGWSGFSLGTSDVDLAFDAGQNVIVIGKEKYTCVDESFIRRLDDIGIDDVHIAGVDTDVCVTKCAIDLFEAGKTPSVLARFCASHAGPRFHESAIEILRRTIGKNQVIE